MTNPPEPAAIRFSDGSTLNLVHDDQAGPTCNCLTCDQDKDDPIPSEERSKHIPEPQDHVGHFVTCECSTEEKERASYQAGFEAASSELKPRPMRIRFMELPGEINPATNQLATPFVMIWDRVPQHGWDAVRDAREVIAQQTGARGVLIFADEVLIGEDE